VVITISRNSPLAIASNTEVTAKYNTVVFNDLNVGTGIQTTGITATTITFPTDGIFINFNGTYVITANVSYAASTIIDGSRSIMIGLNGSVGSGSGKILAASMASPNNTTQAFNLSVTTIARLFISDVINVYYRSTSTSTVNTAIANTANGTLNASLSVALLLQ
jgi:hypothetical protein